MSELTYYQAKKAVELFEFDYCGQDQETLWSACLVDAGVSKPVLPSDEEIKNIFKKHCDADLHVEQYFILEDDIVSFAHEILNRLGNGCE